MTSYFFLCNNLNVLAEGVSVHNSNVKGSSPTFFRIISFSSFHLTEIAEYCRAGRNFCLISKLLREFPDQRTQHGNISVHNTIKLMVSIITVYEECVNSRDLDQSAHAYSVVRVFHFHYKDSSGSTDLLMRSGKTDQQRECDTYLSIRHPPSSRVLPKYGHRPITIIAPISQYVPFKLQAA